MDYIPVEERLMVRLSLDLYEKFRAQHGIDLRELEDIWGELHFEGQHKIARILKEGKIPELILYEVDGFGGWLLGVTDGLAEILSELRETLRTQR